MNQQQSVVVLQPDSRGIIFFAEPMKQNHGLILDRDYIFCPTPGKLEKIIVKGTPQLLVIVVVGRDLAMAIFITKKLRRVNKDLRVVLLSADHPGDTVCAYFDEFVNRGEGCCWERLMLIINNFRNRSTSQMR